MNYALAEQRRQEALDYVEEQTRHAIWLSDKDTSPANAERQLGKSMTSEAFEKKLRRLSRKLLPEPHPHKADKRCLYLVDSRGKQFLCAYESGFMPEHSIMKVKKEEVWTGQTHINKKDLPKYDLTPEGIVWHSGVTPGFQHIDLPWGELKRGWRTVLLKIIGNFIATPTEVEKIFGVDNTREWKGHTRKGEVTTPW